MFKYKAVKAGVLSNPYRFVEEGEVIHSTEEIKASWLVPHDKYKKPKELPVTSANAPKTLSNPAMAFVPPQIASDPNYDAQIAALQEREAVQDGKQVEPEADAVVDDAQENTTASEQNVLE